MVLMVVDEFCKEAVRVVDVAASVAVDSDAKDVVDVDVVDVVDVVEVVEVVEVVDVVDVAEVVDSVDVAVLEVAVPPLVVSPLLVVLVPVAPEVPSVVVAVPEVVEVPEVAPEVPVVAELVSPPAVGAPAEGTPLWVFAVTSLWWLFISAGVTGLGGVGALLLATVVTVPATRVTPLEGAETLEVCTTPSRTATPVTLA